MRRWGSEFELFIWPIVISTKGALNPEALSAQRRHVPMGLRIWRLYLANLDIHGGRSESGVFNRPKDVMRRLGSESGDFVWPIVISMKSTPNPEALIDQS
ncbi:hypothetical protein ACSBR1_015413 [Camellia fascicularis]